MASVSQMLARGQERSQAFLRDGIDTWMEEGRIDEERRDELYASMNAPEVEQALVHVGAHFAISLPLRFPFGATARVLYTLLLRLRAEVAGLLRRGNPHLGRRYHTVIVMLFAMLPGFGRLAYFLSPALAHERLLLVVPADVVARKLPFRAYPRFHLGALFVYWAQPDEPGRGLRHFLYGGWFQDLKHRLAELRPYRNLIVTVVVIDMTALLIGAYLYVDSNEESVWWFDERSVMATLDAVQLLAGGVCGLLAYRLYWRHPHGSNKEAAGIFLWGIGGAGLIMFAFDDYVSLHENLGSHLQAAVDLLPFGINMPDDILILAYAVVGVSAMFAFRMELFEDRPSATMLQFAALAALIMVATDVFATTRALKALEYPSQMLASGLLFVAFLMRYQEVRRPASEPVATHIEAMVR
jgi:hypothetical protein